MFARHKKVIQNNPEGKIKEFQAHGIAWEQIEIVKHGNNVNWGENRKSTPALAQRAPAIFPVGPIWIDSCNFLICWLEDKSF